MICLVNLYNHRILMSQSQIFYQFDPDSPVSLFHVLKGLKAGQWGTVRKMSALPVTEFSWNVTNKAGEGDKYMVKMSKIPF